MPDSFVTPWTVACQAPLSLGFPRQEYWSGLPFPSPKSSNTCYLHQAVALLSRIWLSATPWTAEHQASLSLTISQSLLRLKSIESMMPSNNPILCRSLLFLPSIFPSIKVFSNKLALHTRRPKYWSFSFSISPSNEYSGLIFFRIENNTINEYKVPWNPGYYFCNFFVNLSLFF